MPLLRTANAEISEVIDTRQVQQLPLNGRQFIQLAQLTDGVTIPPGGTRGAALGQAGPLPNVYGQRGGHNIYLIDGVKVTDEYFSNLVISPSVDAIQEFKIQKTMYPVEFGGKASALINVVTKSGANTFHGSALEFVRNNSFDTHNYFDDPTKAVPTLNQNQFGANIGGPIKKDQTFFFFSYEGQRITKAQTQTFSVPTAALRNGNFSALPALCDPLTRVAGGACTLLRNQIPSNRLTRSRSRSYPGATADQRRRGPEPFVHRKRVEPDEPVQPQADHASAWSTLRSRRRLVDTAVRTTTLSESLRSFRADDHAENSRDTHVRPNWLNEVRFGYLHASGAATRTKANFAARRPVGSRRTPPMISRGLGGRSARSATPRPSSRVTTAATSR